MKRLLALGLTALLAACAGTDNSPQPTPLTDLKNSVAFEPLWRASYSGGSLYRFAPDLLGDTVYMAGTDGVAGIALTDGRRLSEIRSDVPLAGGVGAGSGLVVAGTLKGDVYAWDAAGKLKWRVRLSSEVVSPPVVAEGVAVVRTVDGTIWGIDAADGKTRWQFARSQPALILRNYAPVTIADGAVYAGLAAGRIASLSLADGRVLWEALVAPPKGATELERISDVTSAPVVDRGQVCAVAFQGRVACFAVSNGTLLWAREVSSYVGLAVDAEHVYVTDDVGNVQAFERSGGRSLWKQTALYGRRVSGPALIGGYVVVGDYEGYLHLLSPADGALLARQTTDKSAVLVAPHLVAGKLLVQTENGGLHAFAIPDKK
ncbi:outer membrane protein assembly factor BamB [Chitinimonas koreensis]|uniref:outer membrane protein assembly factor BamB n=1 Tax=Chitinimonas koreensis TaxID=356302 RepID=UPI00048DD9C8|nr:outer membrane protein assembly factor BamB [Chitinimonas koreensis]QNM95598.1 outer membrane protein assembly factor BamB [Chitinimonas koreensis]